jgi:hypothetical protein
MALICRTPSHACATLLTTATALSAVHAAAITAFLASQVTVPPAVSRMCRTVRASLASTAMDLHAHRARHVMPMPQRPAHAMAQPCRTPSHANARKATMATALSAEHAPVTVTFLASRVTVLPAVSRMCRTVRATPASMAMDLHAHRARHVMHSPQRPAHAMALICRTRSHVCATLLTTATALSAAHVAAIAAFLASRATVLPAVSRMCRTVRATLATMATDLHAHRARHAMHSPQRPDHAMALTCRTPSNACATLLTTATALSAAHAAAIAAFLESRATVLPVVSRMCRTVRATQATMVLDLHAHSARHVMETPQRPAYAMARA